MKTKLSKTTCSEQILYAGIDVHKKSLTVTVRMCGTEIHHTTMPHDAKALIKYLLKQPHAEKYYTVYEAGFCGYALHRQLVAAGIHNTVINPGFVPSTSKEKLRKNDPVDSRKLARALENGSLQHYTMFCPTEQQEDLRSLVRYSRSLVQQRARVKIQIKSLLNFKGISLPEDLSRGWSIRCIDYLENLPGVSDHLTILLKEQVKLLKEYTRLYKDTIMSLKKFITAQADIKETITLLTSIPGIGFAGAITLYSEIMDINRFSNIEKFAAYMGIIPDECSSGESKTAIGITRLGLRKVRKMIIENAWVALRHDPALADCYVKFCRRMSKSQAIIKIARKLTNRIYYVWKNKKPYVTGVLQ